MILNFFLDVPVYIYIYIYLYTHSGVKVFAPFPFFFFFRFLHICHTWMIQIIKLFFILHKDNPCKYKLQVWNKDFIY